MPKLELGIHEQILETLYEHRATGEFVTLTEAFDQVSFDVLYEQVVLLHQSKLIEFYTAPAAYAVFREPDFIRARIRTEGIQYCEDHYSFFKKYKNRVNIALGALALIVSGYIINMTLIQNKDVSGNGSAQQSASDGPGDSIATRSKDTITLSPPPESLLPTRQAANKPDKIIEREIEQKQGDTLKVENQEQKSVVSAGETDKPVAPPTDKVEEIDLKNNYTIQLDTLNHLIKVSPKVGKWDSTVLAIPLNEKELVQPEFHSQQNVLSNAGDFAFDALGQRFSGIISIGTTEEQSYTIHYVNKPTVFLFGNYPNHLYSYYFKQEGQ